MDSVLIDRTTMNGRRSLHVIHRGGLFGSRPPPVYSSLPPPLLQQPPLLPLPFSKSATLPSPARRITPAAASVRPRPHHKKPRPSAGPRKGPRSPPEAARSDPKPVGKTNAAVERGEDEKEEFLEVSLYSISPPPSSLPLPRFSLMRPKAAASVTCNAEAMGGGGGGPGGRVDATGATDDLRRLLRL